ncbi:MAG: hypothetical protein MUC67_04930 [Acidobacteria bacterium]|nr:hypothetical protein [Acidobacteriota bacterium]
MRRAVVAWLLAAAPAAAAQEPAAVPPPPTPRDLVAAVPARLGINWKGEPLAAREAGVAARRAAAAIGLADALAPLAEPSCSALLAAFGLAAAAPSTLADAWPEDRPVALPGTTVLLVPSVMPPIPEPEAEFLSATGVLPIEVALSGEWLRAVGGQHAGPAPADPLLRAARAARLEGAARLAGIVVSVAGTGVDPREIGSGLLALDQDRAGWPRTATVASAGDPLRSALVRALLEDGLRWAVYHYSRSGIVGLLAGLERPASPAELVRPGVVRAAPGAASEGCRLGPRGAAALYGGDDDAPWVGDLLSDSARVGPAGEILVSLQFESATGAEEAAETLRSRGASVESAGAVVQAVLRPGRERSLTGQP